jgi:hypothetical protein
MSTDLLTNTKMKTASAAESFFGSFNDKLRGENEERCEQYPDDTAGRQRQTSDQIRWKRRVDVPAPSNRNCKKWKAK